MNQWLTARTPSALPVIAPRKLKTLLTWVGTGFVLLTGIATFFGIQTGTLARVVRTNPASVVYTFILVGIAVILALALPGIVNPAGGAVPQIPIGYLVMLLAVAAYLTAWFAPNFSDPPGKLSLPGSVTVTLILAFFLLGLLLVILNLGRFSWFFTLLVVAVASLGSGLYVATKLSVLEATRIDAASIVTSFAATDGLNSIQLKVSGSELAGPLRYRVMGLRPGQTAEQEITEQVLRPSRDGTLDATSPIPIPGNFWTSIRVVTCQELESATLRNCDPVTEQSSFALEIKPRGLGGSLKESGDGKRVQITVSAVNLAANEFVLVSAGAKKKGSDHIEARLHPSSDGTAKWSSSVRVHAAGAWHLRMKVCESGKVMNPCSDNENVASLLVGR